MSVVKELTSRPLKWQPYISPVKLETATTEQLDAMKITPSNKKVSDYVLTLAHDPESLAVRSPLFNAIMYGKEGLSPAERELGAVAASMVNHCMYCISVHTARYLRLTKRSDVIDAVFAGGENPELDEHSQAIFDFSAALARTPSAATVEQVAALRDLGMSEGEIVDLVLASSIFGWANRLMHTLGEPVDP
jgi:uncharacterized peroxidase-related enzyme